MINKVLRALIAAIILMTGTTSVSYALPRVVPETTRDEIIQKYLANRKLEPIEGAWAFCLEMKCGEVVIIKNSTDKFTDLDYVGILTVAKGMGEIGEAKLFLNKGESPKLFPGKYIVQAAFGIESRFGTNFILSNADNTLTTVNPVKEDDRPRAKIEFSRSYPIK